MPGQSLRFVLVTPEVTLLDEPVAALRFPLHDGQIGILPGRAPMIGRLGYGELKVTRLDGGRIVVLRRRRLRAGKGGAVTF